MYLTIKDNSCNVGNFAGFFFFEKVHKESRAKYPDSHTTDGSTSATPFNINLENKHLGECSFLCSGIKKTSTQLGKNHQ